MGIRIALAGNPNSGKTSLFNHLTGAMQKVGNWGGVTVDIKEGTAKSGGEKVSVVDLPGTYSLSALSQEELVARNFIVEEKPDVVVHVIDATSLDRHLYLAVQLMEMGIRPVLALNMWDEVEARKIKINVEHLKTLTGLDVIPTSARSGEGVEAVLTCAAETAKAAKGFMEHFFSATFPGEVESRIQRLAESVAVLNDYPFSTRWTAIKLFEHDTAVEQKLKDYSGYWTIFEQRDKMDKEVFHLLGEEAESLIAESRYGYIAGIVREVVSRPRSNSVETSDRIDSVLTHRFWAYPIFIGFMWLLFQATFKLGEHPMVWIETAVELLAVGVGNLLPAGVFHDLIVDGVIAGVGGVIVFLPNILILFFGISIMEDTGYMARAAFIMDRLMHRIGLHGKSFIPMLMGLGCSVPAIMASRTLESRNDRIKTILLTPLVSCSARLPVFVLFAGALFPNQAGNVVFLFQVVFGFAAFAGMAFLFKLTLFRGAEDIPFVMELPPYRVPTVRSVLIHMWYKAQHYLKKMGGVVLVFSVVLWWAGEYPKSPDIAAQYDVQIKTVKMSADHTGNGKKAHVSALETEKTAAVMARTYIGRTGKLFEPLVRPFGADWRGAVSLITGFVAKEVVVSSMGVLYAVGEEEDQESDQLREKLREHFTPLSGFAFMLFVLLYTPCVVALVTVIRELKSWKWSVFSVAYQVVFAWTAATIVFQAGRLMGM